MTVLDPDDSVYDAFKRTDRYGLLGLKPQPWTEYVRLAVLATFLAPIKTFGCFTAIFFLFVVCQFAVLFPERPRTAFVAACGKLAGRACLLCCGFTSVQWVKMDASRYMDVKKSENARPAAIVSNHISYLDILVHVAHSFPSFVARGNTQSMPLIGPISKCMQCIFVDREFKKGEVKGVSGQVKLRMEEAMEGDKYAYRRPLLLFPEGTTTNGKCLLPFKTGAFLAGQPVLPVILKYGPDRVSPAWESIDALWHMFLMLVNPTHSVTAYELPVYVPSMEERKDPTLYAANVRDLLLKAGGFAPSSATLVDCRGYIAMLKGEEPPDHSLAGIALRNGDGVAPPLRDGPVVIKKTS